jgi:hypothetical protein
MVVMDIYVFQAIKVVTTTNSPRLRLGIFLTYWIISIAVLALMLALPYINFENWPKGARTYIFAIIVALFFSKLVACLFIGVDDIRRGAMWVIGKLFSNPSVEVKQSADGITRSAFLSWLGLGLGSTLFGTFIYGFSNKYKYHVNRVQLAFDNLPASFKGLKIVQISDIHAGSFMDKNAVKHGIEKIMKESPDLILFTGDIVNDHAHEMDNYIDVFGQLKASLGVYSILGNHDYGEYALPRGLSSDERRVQVAGNVEKLKKVHSNLGWKLLMNEHVALERNGESIALLGIENWSMKGNFPKYGKMELAYPGVEKYPFKILMSHDPSHWDGQVRKEYKDIDLMLSGHTHGMQFGVEIPGFKWSPVQYMYKQWAGLYESDNQKLYINRGFGFIGYPGRVGILPEITVLELV